MGKHRLANSCGGGAPCAGSPRRQVPATLLRHDVTHPRGTSITHRTTPIEAAAVEVSCRAYPSSLGVETEDLSGGGDLACSEADPNLGNLRC